MSTRVACAQLAPVLGDVTANTELATAAIRAAVAGGAQVVVLPELVTSGYMFESTEEAARAAVAPDDEALAAWAREAARGEDVVVVGGFCERGADRRVYNSAAIVDATGVLAVYRKLHLWDGEKRVFTPGSELPPVLETAHGRIAVVVCYDMEFWELTRTLALAGADLLCVPTNWPLMPRPDGERPPEVTMAMACARSNRMALACCDRAGTERGQRWTGGTSIVDCDGWVVAAGDAPVADLDLARSRDKRLTELADVLGDRRPELYAAVTATARGLG